jgi:hypothetical protein
MPQKEDWIAGHGGTHLGPDHGSALRNAPKGLAKVPAAAHKGHLKVVLVDVVGVICWREHLHKQYSSRSGQILMRQVYN